ncbi:MAG: hypothetical protein ABS82_17375 [Rhodanobacter sp. SCN 67-45]|nr:MAG: hypothetical protein ABS82_17375 [Rhodanobacter sp. SCN 67-45]
MAGVAALEFLFHLGVGAFPEAAQVLGDLDRAAGGGEQVQGDGDAAATRVSPSPGETSGTISRI